MKMEIPELCLVALIGPSGAGKSTFAAKRFLPTEVLSSDRFRGFVDDDETNQRATTDAFDALYYLAAKRLKRGKLTVVDATSIRPEDRKPLVDLAKAHHVLPVAVVFDVPAQLCHERNADRPDRAFGPHVVAQQRSAMRRTSAPKSLKREGFRYVYYLRSQEEADAVEVARVPLWNDKKAERGPFDIVGDVHGCLDELLALLAKLGYDARREESRRFGWRVVPPEGRKLVFVGDLADRGPDVPGVYRLAMSMIADGAALCVPGNHDEKLLRWLRGKGPAEPKHGLPQSIEQLEREPAEFRAALADFIDGLVGHYVLDGGKLVVAHAGMKEEMQGRASGAVRQFALYGETTGETDEFGLPMRFDWASEYRGEACVVYGHTPVPAAEWLNNTINVDTGCVFGGALTALRYPERELVSAKAARVYSQPAKPIEANARGWRSLSAQHERDGLLDLDDVVGKRRVETRFHRNVTIPEERAAAALEAMSRFAANPAWLIYLPPTMSPCETSAQPGWLERPEEAFDYFARDGVESVVCEEKHMGSRCVVAATRDEEAARERFGVVGEGCGAVVTRTGRPFFGDAAMERAFLDELRGALDRSGFWDEFETSWACFDGELMPWSAKALGLLSGQYAPVGAAARAFLPEAVAALERAASRGLEGAAAEADRWRGKEARASRYVDAYRRYCWRAESIADLRFAPFHLMATEGAVHVDKDHAWHMERAAAIARAGSASADAPKLFHPTRWIRASPLDPESRAEGVRWWEELTSAGGEGMVVKPLSFAAKGNRGWTQPALKVRGREYLRIIYGPEYDAPENLERLRKRGLSSKRSLASREFALGVEALERFVRRDPLRRVHECVFGVLALESEPVDPRL